MESLEEAVVEFFWCFLLVVEVEAVGFVGADVLSPEVFGPVGDIVGEA